MPEKTTEGGTQRLADTATGSEAADFIIVTPGALPGWQQGWLSLAGKAQENLLGVAAQTRELNAFFEGGPVRRLREQFIALGKEGEDAIEELKAHLMGLSEIAAIYERAERSNTDVSAADH